MDTQENSSSLGEKGQGVHYPLDANSKLMTGNGLGKAKSWFRVYSSTVRLLDGKKVREITAWASSSRPSAIPALGNALHSTREKDGGKATLAVGDVNPTHLRKKGRVKP